MKESSKQTSKFIFRFFFWLLAVILIFVIAYCIPGISGVLTSTYIADYDTVFVSDEVECYLVKHESVISANTGGTLSCLLEEGVHVRKYTNAAKVGAEVYTTDRPGIVSYQIDGMEGYFTEDNLPNITREGIDSIVPAVTEDSDSETVQAGDPLFKTVDDKEWFVIFWISKEDSNKYTEGKSVDVVFDENHRVSAVVQDVYDQEKEYLVVLRGTEYLDYLHNARKLHAEVVTVNQTGLLIQQGSIVTLNGKPGVYVKQINGEYEFVRVKVLSLIDENAIVSSGSFTETVDDVTNQVRTINSYDEILKNAKSIDEGGEGVE